MSRWLKYSWYAAIAAIGSGCAGSCSSCSSCGVEPLDSGFDSAKRIENAASVRLTESGLGFLESNLSSLAGSLLEDEGGGESGIVTFEIPTSESDIALGAKATICPNGPDASGSPPKCVIEINLGQSNLEIKSATNHHITVSGTIPIRLQDLPVRITWGLGTTTNVRLNDGGSCSGTNFAQIPVDIRVSISADRDPTHTSRHGYSRITIENISLNEDKIEDSIAICGGALGGILDALKGLVVGQLMGSLTGNLSETVAEQLCLEENPAEGTTCPDGSTADGSGVCRFADNSCAQSPLGIEGKINLGSMLASLSPGTEGGLDFMLVAGGSGARPDNNAFVWGDMNPIANGATLSMMGGAEPRPTTTCVPLANNPLPTGIEIPDELMGNSVAGWPAEVDGPHLGLSLSERFINYTLASAYNSGALCLGVGSDTLGSMLTSDTLGLLVPSLKDLARAQRTAPLAIVLRPQTAPSARVGTGANLETDPLLRIAMNQLVVDFYLWSNDRYIRAFSAQFDLDVPVNLEVDENSALAPVLDGIGVNNPTLANAPLIREDKDATAKALASLLAGQIGSALGGAIDPISLNDSLADLGLSLHIPPSVEGEGSAGLRRLEKNGEGYLGIFAALQPAAQPLVMGSETDVRLVSKQIDPKGLELHTATPDNAPVLELEAKSSLDNGENAIEYQVRLNSGFWRSWQPSRHFSLTDPSLRIQGRHLVEVRSRVVGSPHTADRTPAGLEVLIDKSLPEIQLGERVNGDQLSISLYDVVSPVAALEARWQLDDGAFTEWASAENLEQISVGNSAQYITVEVRDEEGNVAAQKHGLIRGRQDPKLATEGACDCSIPGGNPGSGSTPIGLGFLAGAALLFGARRRRRAARAQARSGEGQLGNTETDAVQALPASAALQGRTLKSQARVAKSSSALAGANQPQGKGSRRNLKRLGKIGLVALAASFNGCSCSDTDSPGGGEGGTGGAAPSCTSCEVLTPGLVGAYASAAVGSDGSVWVAAYNDIGTTTTEANGSFPILFGDLAVGKYEDGEVKWVAVDGLPGFDETLDPGMPGGPPDPRFIDVNGYRQGLTEAGDDVGLWTSIQVGSNGQPHVAYYDSTNRALKYAARSESGEWSIHTVQQKERSDIGRYAKLLLKDGQPVIAYLALEPGNGGAAQSVVRVASATGAQPGSSSDWNFADAAVAQAPCRAYHCASSESCRADTGLCVERITTCDPKCDSESACFDDGAGPTCVEIFNAKHVDTYPEGAGLYISLANTSSGLGLVYYDRVSGNLHGVRQQSGAWQTPFLIDGEGPGPVDTGDTGVGASLFVDANDNWHVSYADGISESVKYVRVAGGNTVETPQIVDDGSTSDGKAIVGDDSSVWVNSSGTILVSYQDATNGQLRLATHDGTGWQKKTLSSADQWINGSTQILEVGGSAQVMAHWRTATPVTSGGIIIVSP